MFSTTVPKQTNPFDLLDSHIDKFKETVNKEGVMKKSNAKNPSQNNI